MIRSEDSEHGDELGGADHAPLGVTPAQEGLDVSRQARLEIDDRLVDEEELLVGEGVGEVALHGQLVLDHLVHLRLEEHVAVLAHRLGPVHGDVGVSQAAPRAVAHAGGDADAGRGRKRRSLVDLPSMKGSRRIARSRSATTPSPPSENEFSESTTNSSPPSRPTVSQSRTEAERRAATARSSSSPASWPKVSFTFLKSSRSMKNTAMGSPSLRARPRSSCAFWLTKKRLGSPVSESWRAWWRSSAVRSSTSSRAERRERTSWLNKPTNKSVTANAPKNTASPWTAGEGPAARGLHRDVDGPSRIGGEGELLDGRPGSGLPDMGQHRRFSPQCGIGKSQGDAALVSQRRIENLVGVEDAQGPTDQGSGPGLDGGSGLGHRGRPGSGL